MLLQPKPYKNITNKLNKNQSLYIKEILKDGIKSFEITHTYSQSGRNNIGRIAHFLAGVSGIGNTLEYISSNDYPKAIFYAVSTKINFGFDKLLHNIAMRKAQVLVRHLKSQGINDENNLTQAVDLYLKKRGGILYSTFVRKFQKNKIKQVARGEKASQFEGVMTYLQSHDAVTDIIQEPTIKAKQSLKKLANSIIYATQRIFN